MCHFLPGLATRISRGHLPGTWELQLGQVLVTHDNAMSLHPRHKRGRMLLRVGADPAGISQGPATLVVGSPGSKWRLSTAFSVPSVPSCLLAGGRHAWPGAKLITWGWLACVRIMGVKWVPRCAARRLLRSWDESVSVRMISELLQPPPRQAGRRGRSSGVPVCGVPRRCRCRHYRGDLGSRRELASAEPASTPRRGKRCQSAQTSHIAET